MTYLNSNGKPNLDRYPKWRDYVKETIEYFLSTLPSNIREQLDYSPDSLKTVMQRLLERYPDIEAALHEPDDKFWDGMVLYVGETYHINLGGFWNVHFEEFEPNYPYGESEVIEGFADDDPDEAICPEWNVLDMIKYRDGEGLSENLKALVKLFKKDSNQ